MFCRDHAVIDLVESIKDAAFLKRSLLPALVRRLHWPTLNTGDANGGCSVHANQVQLCYVAAPLPGENLSPEWTECFMGFPPSWTAPAGQLLQDHNLSGSRGELLEAYQSKESA
ncbi:hypothetical protein [Ktedonobacter sp. SOSP1-85]|uniref:hypothetical protein n=1 Tax=Ktedonobacter sp. SOSP1-85 TaxID=2778367 RepID=UPI00191546AC|nr:hypothetical protein [Ktedonobacter sp. SOSP1-85]